MTWTHVWHALAVLGLANLFLVAFLWVESKLPMPPSAEDEFIAACEQQMKERA